MAIQYFLGFIGSLLACSIVLAVVTKNLAEGIAVNGKKPFFYGAGSAILNSLAAYLLSFVSENPFQVFWFVGGLFLLFGLLHMLLMHNMFFYAKEQNSNQVLIAEVLFGLSVILFTVVIFSTLQFFLKDRNFLLYPIVLSALLFFVPLLIFHSFQAAYDIPPARFPTWKYPLFEAEKSTDIDRGSGRELIFRFEVAEKATDSRKSYFDVRAPETWQLGTLFYCFLDEYNDPKNKTSIEYIDKEDEPYEWWFYKKRKWYQMRKILNPEFSIRESGIKENAVIVCERLLNTTHVSKNVQQIYHER
jgi:hypothetical protein